MTSSVRRLNLRAKRRAARVLVSSCTLYLATAVIALVMVLAFNPSISLLDRDWNGIERLVLLSAFMFPALSVMALIGGWVLFASGHYTGATIAALVPWLWGSAVMFVAVAQTIAPP